MPQNTGITSFLRLVEQPQPTPLEHCLAMFLLHQQASSHTSSTIATYRHNLKRFLTFLDRHNTREPEAITPHIIRRFLVELQRGGLQAATVHKYARAVKAFCNFLVNEGMLDESPMRKVAMPKLEHKIHSPFSIEDVEKLLKACGKDGQGLRDYAMTLALLDTGLRVSEFVSLDVGDVGQDGMMKVRGKGQKERYVHLGAQAHKALLRYLAGRGQAGDDSPLWLGAKGRLTPSGVFQAMKRLGKRADVWPVGPHRFRRTCALWSLRSGMDLHTLRVIMGWSDLQMAQRYIALVKEDIEEAHRQASPVDRFMARKRRKR